MLTLAGVMSGQLHRYLGTATLEVSLVIFRAFFARDRIRITKT